MTSGKNSKTTQAKACITALCCLILLPFFSWCQIPGSNDSTFNPSDNFMAVDLFATDHCIGLQSDGKIIVASTRLKRLNSDGTLDPTFFNSENFIPGEVRAIELQPDGKVVIGGDFTEYYGIPRKSIARLNSDGTIDQTFQPGSGFDKSIYSIAIQPDGKIIVAGSFNTFNGDSTGSIVRLNNSGSIDTTFNSIKLDSASIDPIVFDLKIQVDGKVLAGGYFTYKNSAGNTLRNLIRVDSNGALDSSFDIGLGTGLVNSIIIQPDQKILVAGGLSSMGGIQIPRGISRIHPDGTLDTSFSVNGVGIEYGSEIYKIKSQSDGSIIAIGTFSSFNQIPSPGIVKILSNGVHDSTYNIGTGFNNFPEDLSIQDDDKAILLGNFSGYQDYGAMNIIRLMPNGDIDTNFRKISGFNSLVAKVSMLPSGDYLIGGAFTSFQNTGNFGSCILNPSGNLNASFKQSDFSIASITSQTIQNDGKILLKGIIYTPFSGPTITRLLTDGTIDTSFHGAITAGGHSGEGAIVIQPADQKILVDYGVGNFVRLFPDGSKDSSFSDLQSFDGKVIAAHVHDDGKIILGGYFTTVQGHNYNGIVRLMPDGQIDTTFNPGSGISGNFVNCITVQEDGKYLVGGKFIAFNGQACKAITRLNSDGSLDSTFVAGSGFSNSAEIRAIILQPDGKIIVGGKFYYFNGIQRSMLLRLNNDGTLDNSFQIGSGIHGYYGICTLAFTHDWKIVAGGLFSYYNGSIRNNIVKIHANNNSCNTPPSAIVSGSLVNSICPGDSLTLYRVGGVAGSGGQFKWYSGNCGGLLLGVGDSITVAPDITTTYFLRAESSCGNSPCAFKTINVKSISGIINGTSIYCPGDTNFLTCTGNWDNYIWSTGSTSALTQITSPGNYIVTVSSFSPSCVATDTLSVSLSPAALVQISGDSVICGSTAVVLNAGNFPTYQWSTGLTTQTLTTLIPGPYIVTVHDQFGCAAKDSVFLTSGNYPTVNITSLGPISFCQGDSVLLSTASGFANWNWYRNSNLILSANTQAYVAKTAGSYSCIVTNSSGCSGQSNTIKVRVPCIPIGPSHEKNGEIKIPVEFEHNVWGYPNPTSDKISIETSCEESYNTPRFFQLDGKEIFPEILKLSNNNYAISNLKGGTYFVRHQCAKANHTFKIVVIK